MFLRVSRGSSVLSFLPQRRFSSFSLKQLGEERGLIHAVFPGVTKELSDLIASRKPAVYSGFDPTASSLHIGNLLPLVCLIHFQRAGFQPIAVIGTATAFVGDPSGKNSERAAVTSDFTEKNAIGIKENIDRIFKNHAANLWKSKQESLPALRVVHNMEWYMNLSAVDFIGSVGRNFRMGTMLLKDSVQSRLKSPEGMSYAEFSYQTFQAYDWLRLLQKYNCVFQIGGNDQMGNMTAGYELIRRVDPSANPFCFTVPLVKNESGNKLGKTAGEAVWLDKTKTSVFEFYQFFLRFADTDVENFLKLFTFLDVLEIKILMEAHKEKPELRKAQKKLAEQLTLLVHGEEGLSLAVKATDAFFNSNAAALGNLSMEELGEIYGREFLTVASMKPGMRIIDTVMVAKCFHDERDAQRIIEAGGVYINQRRVQDPYQFLLPGEHVLPNNATLIRVGKKNHYVVKWRD